MIDFHSILASRNPMMPTILLHIRSGLLAACLPFIFTVASYAQTGPPPAVGPPQQNVTPAAPEAPVKVVPRTVDRSPSPLAQLGLSLGSVHKIGVGLGVAKFRTLKVGSGGWISFECMEDNKAGWMLGEKYWINLNNVVFISAPFVSAPAPAPAAAPAPAPKATVAPKTPTKTKAR